MYAHVEMQKVNKNRAITNSDTHKKSNVKQGFRFVDSRPKSLVQRKMQENVNRNTPANKFAILQSYYQTQNSVVNRSFNENNRHKLDLLDNTSTSEVTTDTYKTIQKCDTDVDMTSGSGSESEWEPEDNNAPDGYMDPSEYFDEYGGTNHSDLDGSVWVARLDNWPALWWREPNETHTLTMTGSRAGDVAAAGGDDEGYTWHHCKDYSGGHCTFQQVPTDEHESWGHAGGVQQYESATGATYT